MVATLTKTVHVISQNSYVQKVNTTKDLNRSSTGLKHGPHNANHTFLNWLHLILAHSNIQPIFDPGHVSDAGSTRKSKDNDAASGREE